MKAKIDCDEQGVLELRMEESFESCDLCKKNIREMFEKGIPKDKAIVFTPMLNAFGVLMHHHLELVEVKYLDQIGEQKRKEEKE